MMSFPSTAITGPGGQNHDLAHALDLLYFHLSHPVQTVYDDFSDASSDCSSASSQSSHSTDSEPRRLRSFRQETRSHQSPSPQPRRALKFDHKRLRMSVIKERAQKIKTIPNSPAKPWQLQVMKDVFYDITKYPSENWIAIIAVVIGRCERPLELI
jgi:hypothetical protein